MVSAVVVLATTLFFLQVSPSESTSGGSSAQNRVELTASDVADLRRRADAGDVDAEYRLGAAYQSGNGATLDYDKAAAWYRKAAEKGNPEAQNSLGILYWTGRGVEKDQGQAVKWYREAVRHNHAKAMFNLGVAYFSGEGVAMDDVTAFAWFVLGDKAGSTEARAAVTRMQGEKHWYGISDVETKIGEMYEQGDGVVQNPDEALSWYRKAADHGSSLAAVRAATALISGPGNDSAYQEAVHRCENAAKYNYSPAQFCMGFLYRRGMGVERDPVEAVKWFRRAAAHNHAGAIKILAEMYSKGDEIQTDKAEAYYWLYVGTTLGARGARRQASDLLSGMTKEEVSAVDKKLKKQRLDPKKVHEVMTQEREAPAVTN